MVGQRAVALGHDAVAQGLEAGGLQLVGKGGQVGQAVQLAPLAQSAGPGKNGGHGVGGGLLALQVLVVVLGDGAVGGLILGGAVGGHQHGGHHGQASEGGGHHVAHDVAVIVLAGPDEPALAADDPGHGVVDEGIEIGDAQFVELSLVAFKLLLEHLLEFAVVDLGDGILGGEPQVLLGVDGVLEAGPGEGADALFLVVGALPHGGTVHLLHQLLDKLRLEEVVPAGFPCREFHGHLARRRTLQRLVQAHHILRRDVPHEIDLGCLGRFSAALCRSAGRGRERQDRQ